MKIYNPIGSKERFLEMYRGVNKKALNEYDESMGQTSTQLIEKAFDELRNKQVNIEQTNTQSVNGGNFVEIVTTNQTGQKITFTFKLNSSEADQEGVYNVSDGVLTKFKIESPTINVELPENMKAVQEFNAGHGSEIISVVDEYADFETDTANIGDEPEPESDDIYNEAVNFIDKIPYKKGSENIQSHEHYADNKPTNSKLRVDNNELNKFVSEMEEFIAGAEKDDDIFSRTPEDIMAEINEPSNPQEHAFQREYGDNWEKERKGYLDRNTMTDNDWEEQDALINGAMGDVDETEKKNDYPDQIGTKFKPKNQIPKKKKKPQSVVKLGEESEITSIKDEFFPITAPLGSEDDQLFVGIVNQGIDSHLEGFTKSEFKTEGGRRVFNFHTSELPILFRRLEELGTDEALSWKDDIENYDNDMNEEDVVVVVGDEPENFSDELEGGLADNKQASDFDPEQIMMGMKVEMEHTDDPKVALEIAMDHLVEMPDYYTHLEKMEGEAGNGEIEDGSGVMYGDENDEELEDELLGYKPHNVNDYAMEGHPLEGILDGAEDAGLSDNYGQGEKGVNRANEVNIVKDGGDEEYQGDIGDRYRDAENKNYIVRDDDDGEGDVTLQSQNGQSEIAPQDMKYLERLSEAKDVLKNRSNKLSKKEAVQILINHNIK